jgi:hypothetical protein
MAACGGEGLSRRGVLGLKAWQIMGVDGWRSKCDYDGKKRERSEVGAGAQAGLSCFSKENHPPSSLVRKRRGGGGDNLNLEIKMG